MTVYNNNWLLLWIRLLMAYIKFYWLFCTLCFAMTVTATPIRVVSINLCTDQWLMAFDVNLLDYRVSPLSLDPRYSLITQEVNSQQTIKPELSAILQFDPEIVLMGVYSDPYLKKGLKKQGITLFTVPLTDSIEGMSNRFTQLGELFNQQKKGNHLKQEFLVTIEKNKRSQQVKTVLYLAPNGFTHGKHSHFDFVLAQLGWTNIASQQGIQGTGYLTIEQIVQTNPDIIIIDGDENGRSRAQQFLAHPALKSWRQHRKTVLIPSALLACQGPRIMQAVDYLKKAVKIDVN